MFVYKTEWTVSENNLVNYMFWGKMKLIDCSKLFCHDNEIETGKFWIEFIISRIKQKICYFSWIIESEYKGS